MNSRVIEFYIHEGIYLQHLVAYTPQQNGVPERKNRTLKEMTTCMLQHKSLDQVFLEKPCVVPVTSKIEVPIKPYMELHLLRLGVVENQV